MLALSPRHIGASINIDEVQFFVDYCNASILSGRYFATGFTSPLRVIILGMSVAVTTADGENIRKIALTDAEKIFVRKLFNDSSWFADFTTLKALAEQSLVSNRESKDVIKKILDRFPLDYEGEVFMLSTGQFKPFDQEEEDRLLEAERKAELERSGVTTVAQEVPAGVA